MKTINAIIRNKSYEIILKFYITSYRKILFW